MEYALAYETWSLTPGAVPLTRLLMYGAAGFW